ncbi:MAG: hypothetical protein EHM28_07410 [Spirochaetaceae bacterium]|nr:MAG: hypothetical protein EHM28_07410 [Spirochaetaceae bacterium]
MKSEGRIILVYKFNEETIRFKIIKAVNERNLNIFDKERSEGEEKIESRIMTHDDIEDFNREYGFLHASDPIIFY